MNFTQLLNQIIEESGLSNKEIIEKCEKAGAKISANYLSILKNNPNKVPSEKVAITLAKVCNAKFENILLVQSYLDKAPDFIREFIERIQRQVIEEAKEVYEVMWGEQIEKYYETLDRMSTAEFICECMENWKTNPTTTRSDEKTREIEKLINRIQAKGKKYALVKMEDVKYISKEEYEKMSDLSE